MTTIKSGAISFIIGAFVGQLVSVALGIADIDKALTAFFWQAISIAVFTILLYTQKRTY
jgi:hypothetical protein